MGTFAVNEPVLLTSVCQDPQFGEAQEAERQKNVATTRFCLHSCPSSTLPKLETIMLRPLLSLVTFSAIATTALAQVPPPPVELESSSGVPFPLELTVPGEVGTHVLAGTGIRTKTFLKVKVYAFGLYVDHDAARDALSAFADLAYNDLEEKYRPE